MASPELAHIELYFPKNSNIKHKRELVDLIVGEMKKNKSLNYSGFANEETLQRGIENNLGNDDISGYKFLEKEQENKIKEIIEKTVAKCNKILPLPIKNYIFVLPWFPTNEHQMFNGTTGLTPYNCVFYIFLSPARWSTKALTNSVAHELNHTIFYFYHQERFDTYDLLDQIVMEGLAENFREQTIDKKHSPWALALDKKEALSMLKFVKDNANSKDGALIRSFLFGNNEYKRWTGYSVGYWMVKMFIKENRNLSWERVMKKEPKEILDSVLKKA